MKERITITVDKKILRLLDAEIKKKIFANRSHGVEFLVFKELGEKEEEKKK